MLCTAVGNRRCPERWAQPGNAEVRVRPEADPPGKGRSTIPFSNGFDLLTWSGASPSLLLFLLSAYPGFGPIPVFDECSCPARLRPRRTSAFLPRALPVSPADLNAAPAPMPVAGGVNVHWYGHGFVYLTSSVGIRCAIDPFGPETVHYKFPVHLAADFVLSHARSGGPLRGGPDLWQSADFSQRHGRRFESGQWHTFLRRWAAKGSRRPGRRQYRFHPRL